MLPATRLVTILSFLLELCSSSPVYNMQPAYITATIGSTGRNIRNLPCISRKNNHAGVCMFAIDCLKSNGTHLGTCIDRFYFGSCCHIEPLHDIIENTIDTALLPSRKPPNRIATTEKITTTVTSEKAEATTNMPITTLKEVSTEKLKTTISDITTKLTTIAKVTEATTLPIRTATRTTTTKKPIITTKVTEIPLQKEAETTIAYKLSTYQSVDSNDVTTTPKPVQTTKPFITTRPVLITKPAVLTTKPTLTSKPSITTKPTLATKAPFTNKPVISIKPSTTITRFPITKPPRPITIKPNTTKVPVETIRPTSQKPTKITTHKPKPVYNVTVIYKPTTKPRPSVTKPIIKATKPTTKPVITKSTLKPFKTTAKPIKTTIVPLSSTTVTVPSTTTAQTTTPAVITTHKPLDSVTILPRTTTTTKTTSIVVTSPNHLSSTTMTTTAAPITTQSAPILTTTENYVKIPDASLQTTTEILISSSTTKVPNSTVSVSNDVPVSAINATQILEAVNGNPATNEIESEKPEKPGVSPVDVSTLPTLVTWAQVNNDNTTDIVNLGSSTDATQDPEDWVPITTPDGWVLLPSLSTVTESSIETTTPTTTSSTEKTVTNQTSSEIIETHVSNTTSSSTIDSLQAIPNSTTDTGPLSSSTTTISPIGIESSTIGIGHNNAVNMTDFTDVCGRRMFPEARIVGGEKSSFGKWPWQISLRQWRTSTYLHKCGAALLNENWAITAAHCVDNVPPSDLLLRLGEHDLSTESEPYLHQERRVQIVASHPQFDPRTFEYDLALLRFYEPVTFQPNILPVCVPQNDENFVGRTAYVTGWGRLYEDGPLPSILQEVSVPVINNTVCESMYRSAGYIEHIPNIFICAGWRRGGFDSCEGDSGGPMVIQRPDKRFLLAGVISWGIGCAEPNQPGVYTRISEFRDWINQILQF